MFQCLGLGSVETGGCGEDWWHPECLIGLPRKEAAAETVNSGKLGDNNAAAAGASASGDGDNDDEEQPLPPGFPGEDDFETFICYKCLDSNPWLKRYAGTPGFLPPVLKDGGLTKEQPQAKTDVSNDESLSKKRKADEESSSNEPTAKRPKEETEDTSSNSADHSAGEQPQKPKHDFLPQTTPSASFSLFLKEDFRDYLCRCPTCFPNLAPYRQLREEEDTYEPPLSEDGGSEAGNGGGSTNETGSLLDRGEAALSNIDRVRAIEGAMVYNHLRDKVKEFLRPFAESGQAVSAEDIKGYFEKLRGDDQGINQAGNRALQDGANSGLNN